MEKILKEIEWAVECLLGPYDEIMSVGLEGINPDDLTEDNINMLNGVIHELVSSYYNTEVLADEKAIVIDTEDEPRLLIDYEWKPIEDNKCIATVRQKPDELPSYEAAMDFYFTYDELRGTELGSEIHKLIIECRNYEDYLKAQSDLHKESKTDDNLTLEYVEYRPGSDEKYVFEIATGVSLDAIKNIDTKREKALIVKRASQSYVYALNDLINPDEFQTFLDDLKEPNATFKTVIDQDVIIEINIK